ncbi:MAG: hypothetical protein INR72_20600, partial [Williamsia herbipolensis]|nr:hypothetical protein [Williamsia herbipolensis]
GGATEIHNLVLLCPYHHHQHHHSDWQIVVREGIPTFVPPAWLDPLQTPRSNRTLPGAA